MTTRMLQRREEFAVNCFTGSFVALAEAQGATLSEHALFESGDCFLFQAGLDEQGLPEYIFPVEEAGVLGMERRGARVGALPVDPTRMRGQLGEVVAEHGPVIAWVNTSHLGYADVYSRTPPYLHSVLVRSIDPGDRVRLFDCMVADTERYSCEAELEWPEFERAVTDVIRSDAHDCMGRYYTADTSRLGAGDTTRALLAGQAARFAAEDRFSQAIAHYARLNAEFLMLGDPRSEVAGRRLFDHSTVLYAGPSLSLLRRSLANCQDVEAVIGLVDAALEHWRAIGVLGLRFAATGSPKVLARLGGRFEEVDEVTRRIWERLA